jgi:diaminopimelate decarboxylase
MSSHFNYQNNILFAEDLSLEEVAQQFGTPCYVYSRAAIESQWRQLDDAFGEYPHLICYAVKANSNLAVLNLLARMGSGFDIVSSGELKRVVKAGGDPQKVVFSGVAKTAQELKFVINSEIRSINVESLAELDRIQTVAQSLGKTAPIAIRVNPDVDAKTHPYIATGLEEAKFGINMQDAVKAYQLANDYSNIEVHGIACHIGSQITETQPFEDAVKLVLDLVNQLRSEGIEIRQLDLGGGLGIQYQNETPPNANDYVQGLINCAKQAELELPIAIEPGRFIVGNAGVLLTKVEYLKANERKSFAIVDAAMNDLLRPSLYQAYHNIVPIRQNNDRQSKTYDVVGPVCETGDVLGYDRNLAIAQDDLLAVLSAGAYGFVMASNYNSRPKPPEVMVDKDQMHIVRRRETEDELTNGEAVLPQ